MKRYETDVRDDVLYVETDDGWLEIGSMADVRRLVGGATYSLEYDERQRAVGWLDTDPDGTLSFDVGETVAGMDFDREFVTALQTIDGDETDGEGIPRRAVVFADLMTSIWDAKGSLDRTAESDSV
ncbi:hypothetical protein [Halococcus saccharolyticus]|uniref:Uncharacterized protein n=1 Tax=Halococcus saccharolyticus DSM 5350 TaxID=1227455 RepID=M0MPX4_9EURY|nr:hypothetical protein [Halococcus saccharolyticus]EMA47408.1 hypothetical protein C449_01641 [Halococcus saccharolyticus DSM 5350]